MSYIERWEAANSEAGPAVRSDQDEPGTFLALCGRQQDAEEIAMALNNNRGAVANPLDNPAAMARATEALQVSADMPHDERAAYVVRAAVGGQ